MASKPKRAKLLPNTIGKENLIELYYLPAEEAGKKLGVTAQVLKSLCSVYHIPRWPYKKVQLLQRLLMNVKEDRTTAHDLDLFQELVHELEIPVGSSFWKKWEQHCQEVGGELTEKQQMALRLVGMIPPPSRARLIAPGTPANPQTTATTSTTNTSQSSGALAGAHRDLMAQYNAALHLLHSQAIPVATGAGPSVQQHEGRASDITSDQQKHQLQVLMELAKHQHQHQSLSPSCTAHGQSVCSTGHGQSVCSTGHGQSVCSTGNQNSGVHGSELRTLLESLLPFQKPTAAAAPAPIPSPFAEVQSPPTHSELFRSLGAVLDGMRTAPPQNQTPALHDATRKSGEFQLHGWQMSGTPQEHHPAADTTANAFLQHLSRFALDSNPGSSSVSSNVQRVVPSLDVTAEQLATAIMNRYAERQRSEAASAADSSRAAALSELINSVASQLPRNQTFRASSVPVAMDSCREHAERLLMSMSRAPAVLEPHTAATSDHMFREVGRSLPSSLDSLLLQRVTNQQGMFQGTQSERMLQHIVQQLSNAQEGARSLHQGRGQTQGMTTRESSIPSPYAFDHEADPQRARSLGSIDQLLGSNSELLRHTPIQQALDTLAASAVTSGSHPLQ